MERRWESRPSWRFGDTHQHASSFAGYASETVEIVGIDRDDFTMVVANHDNNMVLMFVMTLTS